jgi:hypothetical protein
MAWIVLYQVNILPTNHQQETYNAQTVLIAFPALALFVIASRPSHAGVGTYIDSFKEYIVQSTIKNRSSVLKIFIVLVVMLFSCVFFSPAFAQDWTNHHQTIHCSVNINQTFMGNWREISLIYTSANDSGSFINYKCVSCNATTDCNVWAGFMCTIASSQAGQGSFSGRNSVVAIFYPGFATQQNSCEEVYQKADILLQ